MPATPCHSSALKLSLIAWTPYRCRVRHGAVVVQDVDGTFTAAEPGQAVLDRLASYHGGLAGRLGQRQPGTQPGRERCRVGAAGAVGGRDAMPGDRDGHVP